MAGLVWNTDHDLAVGSTLVDGVLIGAAVVKKATGWRLQMVRRDRSAPATRLHISEGHATRALAMEKAQQVTRQALEVAAPVHGTNAEAVT